MFRVQNEDGERISSFVSYVSIFIFLFLILEWTGTSFTCTTANMYVKYYTRTVSHMVSRNGCMMQQGCIKWRRTLSLRFFYSKHLKFYLKVNDFHWNPICENSEQNNTAEYLHCFSITQISSLKNTMVIRKKLIRKWLEKYYSHENVLCLFPLLESQFLGSKSI